jgi:hypothetical protein
MNRPFPPELNKPRGLRSGAAADANGDYNACLYFAREILSVPDLSAETARKRLFLGAFFDILQHLCAELVY